MSDSQAQVLLTNDDGVDSPGLAALYEELRAVAAVTVVAPVEDQSGVGRSRSRAVDVDDHEWGHAVHGTPADCVAYGLRSLSTDFDLVVSGCNLGPNCGEYIMGHSGTVGAAVEAAYLGTPALAVSAYHREEFFPPEAFTFEVPARITRLLAAHVLGDGAGDGDGDDTTPESGDSGTTSPVGTGDATAAGAADAATGAASRADLADADYLSVNAPVGGGGELRLTEPLANYAVDVREATAEERETYDGDVRLESDFWARLDQPDRHPTLERVGDTYPAWSDRAAVVNGDVSVSPLRVPQTPVHSEALDALVSAANRAWLAEREATAAADDD
ncbi:5'/3'-nucleotidase SurE [Halobacteriales archaeon QS_6_71_20]|nr:MAG: 5'/3'-nucleotidase SurE [Halobacteriales archaeon QS_6_71_20]